jgi:hypothetical protein
METIKGCLRIIWECQYKNKLKFWALENPCGRLRLFLGKPFFNFQPWEFGDLHSKSTDIWGYFNIPVKTVKSQPENMQYIMKPGHKKKRLYFRDDPYNQYKYLFNAQTRAAITPPGFANAFYKANK